MDLRVLDGTFALCRLAGGAGLPPWFALDPPLAVAIRRGAEELSLIAPDERVPDGVQAHRGWRAIELDGPLDLALTGVTAEVATVLAAAGVPILPLATHDTDVFLVRDGHLDDATAALRAAGHNVAA